MKTKLEIPEKIEALLKDYREKHLPIYIEEESGCTEGSRKFICNCLLKIYKKPRSLYAFKPGGPDNCMDVWTVICFEDACIVVRGFSFGYSGEGSRGLEWAVNIFRMFNKTPNSTIFENNYNSEISFG